MIKLVLLVTLVIAIISLLMNILMWIKIGNVSDKRKELKGEFIKFQKDTTYSLENHKQHIEGLLYKMKQIGYAPTQNILQSVQQPVQNPIQKLAQQPTPQPDQQPTPQPDQQPTPQPDQQPTQQPAQQPAPQSVQQSGKGKHNKHGKSRDRGSDKPQQPVVIRTIYLGINSDDFFFDNEVDEQKNATSKFIGYLTSETDGTFVPIDVERIRSANVAASVKQQGLISLKDAQTLIVVEAGKIRKEEGGWLIQSPAVVEFNK